MWDFLISVLTHAYTQVVILFVFIWYFFVHRQDPHLKISRVGLIRIIILGAIFLYFLLSWSSGIRPALAQAAVLGMGFINLLFLFNLALNRLERPYRKALEAYYDHPENQQHLDDIWRTGKRFYYLHNLIQSMLSGMSPIRYLRETASGRIRDDVQDCLYGKGEGRQFISLRTLLAYLQSRLEQDDTLPQEFKEMMTREIQRFGQHTWIEDRVDEYLRTAMESPEDLHNPEWSHMWDKARGVK